MKSKKVTALFAAAAMLGTMAAMPAMVNAAVGDDLIHTGHMEDADENNIPYYSFAKTDSEEKDEAGKPKDKVSVEKSTEQFHTGTYSLKVTNRNSADSGAGNYFTQPTAGTKYRITASIYPTETDTFHCRLSSGYWKDAGSAVGECEAGKWTTITADVTVSEWTEGAFHIYSEKNAADFYVDDVSVVELSSGEEPAELTITDNATFQTAMKTGGTYTVKNDFNILKLSVKDEEATTGVINGNNKTITHTDYKNYGAIYQQENAGNWTFNDMTITAGKAYDDATVFTNAQLFVLNNDNATMKFDNVTFKNIQLGDSSSCILTNRKGNLYLNNVKFENITYDESQPYDLISEWGGGNVILQGATKIRALRTANYYQGFDFSRLTEGCDVFIKADSKEIYDKEKAKSYDTEKLVMVTDDAAMTIHIMDKPKTHEEGFKFSKPISLNELNGANVKVTREIDGVQSTSKAITSATVTTGDGQAIVGIIVTDIPDSAKIVSINID